MGAATLSRAQESFYTALRQMSQAVTSVRNLRAQHTPVPDTTEKSDLHGVTDQYKAVRASSKIRIQAIPGQTEFESTVKVIDHLLGLGSDTEGKVICMTCAICSPQKETACSSVQSFWTRKGKQPPQIQYHPGSLDAALAENPIVILINPDTLKNEHVPGYVRIDMDLPLVTLLIREKNG